jgi:putative endonuclease
MNRKGEEGERKAAEYLQAKGYEVLARNYRTRRGEIDLVARKGGKVVFVEVKNWTALGQDSLGQAIGAEKRHRIVSAARHFLHEHPPAPGCSFAFDVVLLKEREITHIEDAFDGE